MKCRNQMTMVMLTFFFSASLWAGPFKTCPSKAFLAQGTTVSLYGVNLVTGQYITLADNLGTNDRFNGFGFNFHDNYIYGWAYEWGTLGRFGDDYKIQPLELTNKPDTNFYVGDVAIHENAYFFYKPGSQWGLYRASLDENANDYLEVTRIIDGGTLNLRIFDLAFYPDSALAYSVDSNGFLHRIDVSTGQSTNLGNVGQSGTFGAVYFDVEGTFYISRNNDGHVYKINVDSSDPTAEFFAYGPSSSQNDGGRCAVAPIIDDTEPATIDFGDAPTSYKTTMSDNGARHGISDLYLGSQVDAEYFANGHPYSDDSAGVDDEDGVTFLTTLEAGFDAIVRVESSGTGFFSLWIDVDGNGSFDQQEALIADRVLTAGTHYLRFSLPLTVNEGQSWSRARISTTPNLLAYGGAVDGEVEDSPVYLVNDGASVVSQSPFVLAFEDNFPQVGDFDLNDVVISLASSQTRTASGDVKQLELSGQLIALGASYHNGFAIDLFPLQASDIDETRIRFQINGVDVGQPLIDTQSNNLVVIIADDLWDHVKPQQGCSFYRTQSNCYSQDTMTYSIRLPFVQAKPQLTMPQLPFNPFIFATPNTYHGDLFSAQPGRSLEIHLKNKAPTNRADMSYFGTYDDASVPDGGLYYQTESGLPWAVAMSVNQFGGWKPPLERVDLLEAYPKFESFVSSKGASDSDWFSSAKMNINYVYNY